MQNYTYTKYYIYEDKKLIKETYIKKDADKYAKKGHRVLSRRKKIK